MIGPLRTVLLIVVLLVLLGLPATGAAVKSTPFEVALAAAKANVETEAGKKYDKQFGKQFAERYVDTTVRCTAGATTADLARFDLLVRVSGTGVPEEVLVQPATMVAKCLREEVRKGKFRSPHRKSYWVRIEMNLKS